MKPYYERFLEAFPDTGALAAAPQEQLLKLWEGLGYYSRAKNLQKAAMAVEEQYGGRLPADYEALLKLPGIGSYTGRGHCLHCLRHRPCRRWTETCFG